MAGLTDWHEHAEAEFQAYFGIAIVSTYGRLPLEYAAMFRSAAVLDMAQRGVIWVTGEDRHAFLNNILTAELVDRTSGRVLAAGESRFSFLLDRKGRLLAEINVLETGDRVALELDRRLMTDVAKELEKYHFREKVAISADGDTAAVAVIGPGAAKLLTEGLGIDATGLMDGSGLKGGGGVVVWRMDLGPAPMFTVLAPSAEVPALWERLVADSKVAIPAGWAAYNALRVEAGRGLFGIDYDSTFLPEETGQIERGVSFTKGCYPGQEIVARMHSRGQFARKLVQLKMESDALPVAGAKVYDDADNEVGGVTSSTISPRQSGIALALAIVKREAIDAGKPLVVPAEGAMCPARVAGQK